MNKDELLQQFSKPSEPVVYSHNQVIKAMDEHAEQVAIGFAQWLFREHYRRETKDNEWFNLYDKTTNIFTTHELYNLYLQSIQK